MNVYSKQSVLGAEWLIKGWVYRIVDTAVAEGSRNEREREQELSDVLG